MMKKMITALLATVVLATPLAAQSKPYEDDEMILADASRLIAYNVHYTVYDVVGIEVEDGQVILSGYVTMGYKKESFERDIVERVDGVKGVDNRIEVLPASGADSILRYAVARNIYNDSRMLRYRIEPFPRKIHVIVKHGRVYLEGSVDNKMDRRIAELRAREVFGILSVTNNLMIE